MKRTANEADRLLGALQQLVEDFRRDAATLHRALMDGQPGYPTATIGGGTGGGGPADPTARFALEGDTCAADLDMWYTALDNGYQWLLQASHVRSRHLPAMSTVKRCANPNGCPGYRLAAEGRAGLCQPCWRNRPTTAEAA